MEVNPPGQKLLEAKQKWRLTGCNPKDQARLNWERNPKLSVHRFVMEKSKAHGYPVFPSIILTNSKLLATGKSCQLLV